MFSKSIVTTVKNTSKLLAGFCFFLFVSIIFLKGNAFAYNLTPDPGRGVGIPVANYDYLNNYIHATPCTSSNHQLQSPAFTQWIGLEGSPAQTSIIVQAGTPYVDLRYWTAGVNCWNTRGLTGNYKIVGASSSPAGTISNIVGNVNTLDWRTDFNQPGKYKSDSKAFRFSPSGGFTTTRTYTISIQVKAYNVWNGTGIACIAPNSLGVGISSGDLCPVEVLTFNIAVYVDHQPKLTIVPDCANQRFNITSSDQDGGPYKVAYGIDNKPLVILPNNFSATPLTVTIPMVDKNQHTIQAFTAGKDPSGGAGWWTLKNATYGPCLPPPSLSCNVDSPSSTEPGAAAGVVIKLRASNFTADSVTGNLTISIKQGSANLSTGVVGYTPKPFGSNSNSVAFSSPIPIQAQNNYTSITVVATLGQYMTSTPCGTITLQSKPYLSFYGGDVCSRGIVKTFNRAGPTDYAGSGSQLATFAAGVISNASPISYTTAKMRANNATSQESLAFANESTYFGSLTSPPCPDLSSPATITTNNTWPGIGPTLASGAYIYGTGGTSTMSGGQIPNGRQVTLYINGDLAINGNITYTNSYNNLSDIPSFTVIVNGNIYIDNDVSQIEGTYIARGSSGKIYTCADATGSTPQTNPYLFGNLGPNCDNQQLNVYGALYANEIRWFRTINSLKDATTTEGYATNSAAETVVDGPFRYYPHPTNSTTFDAYTSLSPIL